MNFSNAGSIRQIPPVVKIFCACKSIFCRKCNPSI